MGSGIDGQALGDELHITLADFGDVLAHGLPGFKKVPVAKLLVEGIPADADSPKPELRFWARFVIELGKYAGPSYDGHSGKGEHQFWWQAERHPGAKVNSSRNAATLTW